MYLSKKQKDKFKVLRKGNSKKKHWDKYPNYIDYLKSDEWSKVKNIFLSNKKKPRCQFCGTTDKIEVHHLAYNRLGTFSEIKDLSLFCRGHHQKIHTIEKEQGLTVRQATKALMKTKPKKVKRFNTEAEKRRFRVLRRKKRREINEEKKAVMKIKEELRLMGVTANTNTLSTLQKIKKGISTN